MPVMHLSSQLSAVQSAAAAADTDWRNRSACLTEDPDLFFSEGEGAAARLQTAKAKQVCAGCPVMDQCRKWALETGQEHGVWGGMDALERRNLGTKTRQRSRKAAECGTRAAYCRHVRWGEDIDEACKEANRVEKARQKAKAAGRRAAAAAVSEVAA